MSCHPTHNSSSFFWKPISVHLTKVLSLSTSWGHCTERCHQLPLEQILHRPLRLGISRRLLKRVFLSGCPRMFKIHQAHCKKLVAYSYQVDSANESLTQYFIFVCLNTELWHWQAQRRRGGDHAEGRMASLIIFKVLVSLNYAEPYLKKSTR